MVETQKRTVSPVHPVHWPYGKYDHEDDPPKAAAVVSEGQLPPKVYSSALMEPPATALSAAFGASDMHETCEQVVACSKSHSASVMPWVLLSQGSPEYVYTPA